MGYTSGSSQGVCQTNLERMLEARVLTPAWVWTMCCRQWEDWKDLVTLGTCSIFEASIRLSVGWVRRMKTGEGNAIHSFVNIYWLLVEFHAWWRRRIINKTQIPSSPHGTFILPLSRRVSSDSLNLKDHPECSENNGRPELRKSLPLEMAFKLRILEDLPQALWRWAGGEGGVRNVLFTSRLSHLRSERW